MPFPGGFEGTDRFRVIRMLGAGGMGVVYEVLDRERNVRLALKELPRLDPRALYRFKLEFRSLSDIAHPNLVSLYELLNEGEHWFFTMELVPGRDFLDYIAGTCAAYWPAGDDRALEETMLLADGGCPSTWPEAPAGGALPQRGSEERLRPVLVQLGEGLVALHGYRKLHRDIKPSNLRITPEGRAVLLDFGLVLELGEEDAQPGGRVVAGTVAYMSPEQAQGQPLTEASDWYSVGVMLYEALAGRFPFTGGLADQIRQKRAGPPVVPSQFRTGVPPDLERLSMDLLAADPIDRPGGQEFLQRLKASAPQRSGARQFPAVERAPFIGRERHLAALGEALEAVDDGQPAIVCVSGDSGTGKSTLVRHFLAPLARQENFVVLAGRCLEQESVPFKALDSVIDSLAAYLRRQPGEQVLKYLPRDADALSQVFLVLRTVEAFSEAVGRRADIGDQARLRRWAFQGLREMLSRMGDRRRLVVAMDDVQWGDADSARALVEVLSPPDPPAMLLILARRPEPDDEGAFLPILRKAHGLRHWNVTVDPLSQEEAARVASSLLGQEKPGRAEALARESGGNPYFLHELVAYAGSAEPPGGAGNYSLESLLRERIGGLPATARRLLELVVICGQPLRQDVAYRAAGLDEMDPALVFQLRSARLIRCTGPRGSDYVEPYHDRVREIAGASLDSDTLRSRHLGLARTLRDAQAADAEMLAIHFEAGGEVETAGVYYSDAAAQAAAATAFDHAANLYQRAMALQAGERERQRLEIPLADALANAGRSFEAAEVYRQAAQHAAGDAEMGLSRKAGYFYCVSGHVEEARHEFRKVLAHAGLRFPASGVETVASLLAARSGLALRGMRHPIRSETELPAALLAKIDAAQAVSAGLGLIDQIKGVYFSSRALLLALRAGEPGRLAYSLALEAAALAVTGTAGERKAMRVLDRCRALVDRYPSPRAKGVLAMVEGLIAFTVGRWQDGIRHLEAAELILGEQCTGVPWELDSTRAVLMLCHANCSHYSELNRRIPQLLRQAQDRGDLYLFTFLCGYAEPIMLLAAGRPDEALRAIDNVDGWLRDDVYLQHILAFMSGTMVRLYQGRPVEAWQFVETRWPRVKKKLFLHGNNTRAYCLFVRANAALAAASSLSSGSRLIAEAEAAARVLAKLPLPFASPMAMTLRAGIASARSQPQESIPLLERAAQCFDRLSMANFSAACRRRLGLLVGGDRGREISSAAENSLKAQQVQDPARFAATVVPGQGESPA